MQVVYGARGGSDGSGTIPRRVGKLVEEDLQRLRALEPQNSLLTSSPQWGGAENLEVRTAIPPRLHASSPLDQRVPLIEWTSPINNYSDLSSVPHGSIERSIPSTLLTSPNFSSRIDNTTSSSKLQTRSQRSSEMPSLRTIHEESPRHSISIVQAEVYPTSPREVYPLPAGAIRSRVPELGLPILPTHNPKEIEKELYWRKATYRDADSLFPNYALNYPAPIHGNLSPSMQYPEQIPPRFGFEEIGILPHSGYYQNPLATSSPPPSRARRVQESGYQDTSRTINVPTLSAMVSPSASREHHDYENTRYCSHRTGQAPPLYVAPPSLPQPDYPGSHLVGHRHRKTAVIDGAIRRIRPGQLGDGSRLPRPRGTGKEPLIN